MEPDASICRLLAEVISSEICKQCLQSEPTRWFNHNATTASSEDVVLYVWDRKSSVNDCPICEFLNDSLLGKNFHSELVDLQ
jgi:hypothetical protein